MIITVLAWDLPIIPGLITLTLFQGHRYIRIINCKYIFFILICGSLNVNGTYIGVKKFQTNHFSRLVTVVCFYMPERTCTFYCISVFHYYPSHQLVYRAATELLHPCLSQASLWMVLQLWFMFFISASTVLHQVVFG